MVADKNQFFCEKKDDCVICTQLQHTTNLIAADYGVN